MKITKLTIHNFLKLKDVTIDPEKVNVIVGKNKQGKTSILKAIQAAFEGGMDAKVINDSEEKAEIVVELDEYRVERSVTRGGTQNLKVSNKDGWNVPAPQKFLDGLIGQFSFNPIEFFNLKSADKKKYLLSAIDIKLTAEKLEEILGEKVDMDLSRHGLEVIADLHKHYYTLRTSANSSVSKLEKTYDTLKASLPEGFDPASVNEERISELREQITANEVNKEKVEASRERIAALVTRKQDLEDELKKVTEDIALAEKEAEALPAIADTSVLKEELTSLESQRELVHTAKQADDTMAQLDEERKEQARLNTIVKKLSKEVPDQLIKEADLPVEGLAIQEESITLNGVDVENLSASEQLQFALAIVRKLNDKFKVICIDGAESLDKETFEWFLSEIEKDDFEYFITRVDGDKGLFVEDGQVKKA